MVTPPQPEARRKPRPRTGPAEARSHRVHHPRPVPGARHRAGCAPVSDASLRRSRLRIIRSCRWPEVGCGPGRTVGRTVRTTVDSGPGYAQSCEGLIGELMDGLAAAAGAALVLLVLRDIFHTLGHPEGQGSLGRLVPSTIWRLSRFRSGRGRGRLAQPGVTAGVVGRHDRVGNLGGGRLGAALLALCSRRFRVCLRARRGRHQPGPGRPLHLNGHHFDPRWITHEAPAPRDSRRPDGYGRSTPTPGCPEARIRPGPATENPMRSITGPTRRQAPPPGETRPHAWQGRASRPGSRPMPWT